MWPQAQETDSTRPPAASTDSCPPAGRPAQVVGFLGGDVLQVPVLGPESWVSAQLVAGLSLSLGGPGTGTPNLQGQKLETRIVGLSVLCLEVEGADLGEAACRSGSLRCSKGKKRRDAGLLPVVVKWAPHPHPRPRHQSVDSLAPGQKHPPLATLGVQVLSPGSWEPEGEQGLHWASWENIRPSPGLRLTQISWGHCGLQAAASIPLSVPQE